MTAPMRSSSREAPYDKGGGHGCGEREEQRGDESRWGKDRDEEQRDEWHCDKECGHEEHVPGGAQRDRPRQHVRNPRDGHEVHSAPRCPAEGDAESCRGEEDDRQEGERE